MRFSLIEVLQELNRRNLRFAKMKRNEQYYVLRIKEIEKIIKYIDSISEKLCEAKNGSSHEKQIRENLRKGPIAMFFLWENPSFKTVFEESWSKEMLPEQRIQKLKQLRTAFLTELKRAKRNLI